MSDVLCAMLIGNYYEATTPKERRVYLHTLGLAIAGVGDDSYFAHWLATHAETLIGWADTNPIEFATVRKFLEHICSERGGSNPH